jgi:four helix bundle protein
MENPIPTSINKRPNALKEKSYRFALQIIRAYQDLQKDKREFVLSKQLLRSGTAIGALVEEANQAESKADFIHKLSIANKEANETKYWIRLLIDSEILDSPRGLEMLSECNEIVKILASSIITSKNRK